MKDCDVWALGMAAQIEAYCHWLQWQMSLWAGEWRQGAISGVPSAFDGLEKELQTGCAAMARYRREHP